MQEGYHCSGEGDCSYSWLDEWMCEYVDGTMDPAVRRSFEEYVRAEPELARRVERLRRTRTLLCRHGCRIQAPEGLQARVRRRMAWEMMRHQRPVFSEALSRLGTYAALASCLLIVLMAGMLAGAYLYDEASPAIAQGRTPPNRFAPLTPQPTAMTPLLGQAPMRQPWFVNRSEPVLLSLSRVRYTLPEAPPMRPPVPDPHLQRTGAVP